MNQDHDYNSESIQEEVLYLDGLTEEQLIAETIELLARFISEDIKKLLS